MSKINVLNKDVAFYTHRDENFKLVEFDQLKSQAGVGGKMDYDEKDYYEILGVDK